MSVGLLIITHNGVGQVLTQTALDMLETRPMELTTLEVDLNCDIDKIENRATQALEKCDQGQGVLILTDIFGSTPSNVASLLLKKHQACAVSGLNLPMLIRVLNYPNLDLQQLAEKALTGAKDGIISWGKAEQ